MANIASIGQGHDVWMAKALGSQRKLFFCQKCWGYAEKQAKRLTKPCAWTSRASLSERAVKNCRAISKGRHPEGGAFLETPCKVDG